MRTMLIIEIDGAGRIKFLETTKDFKYSLY